MELGFCESKQINIDTMLRVIMGKVFNEIRKPLVLEKMERINSKFLRDCLDGILSFAHLINIDLISSMI